jgi:drug/metabolite transporter (DMT)-like permease
LTTLQLFAACVAIWGSTWLAITFQLGSVAPEVSVAYRFGLAALVLSLWCATTGRSLRFTRTEHLGIAAQGTLMFGLNYIGVYRAEAYVASGLVAVLFSTIVFMNLVASRFLFRTPLTARMLVGAACGVGGVALLFLPELAAARKGGAAALGIAYGLGATLLAFAAMLAREALAGGFRNVEGQPDAPAALPSFLWVSAAVLAHLLIIGSAGFVVATVVLFVGVARGIGSTRPLRDGLIGLVLAVVVFLLFTRGLGINLPAGPLRLPG